MAKSMADVAREEMAALPPDFEGFKEKVFQNPLEREGQHVIGEYVAKAQKLIGGKPINVYRIKNGQGALVTVFGAAQIDTFFETVDLGAIVAIVRGKDKPHKGGKRLTEYRCFIKE